MGAIKREPSGFLDIEVGNEQHEPLELPTSSTFSRLMVSEYYSCDEVKLGLSKTFDPVVVGGSIRILIQLLGQVNFTGIDVLRSCYYCSVKLTSHLDRKYINEFLVSFPYFTNTREVVSQLSTIYQCVNVPERISERGINERFQQLTQQR